MIRAETSVVGCEIAIPGLDSGVPTGMTVKAGSAAPALLATVLAAALITIPASESRAPSLVTPLQRL
jgi:hypothetical protein